MRDKRVILKRAKIIYTTCSKVKVRLENTKHSDLATQMDSIYYGTEILYKILSSYNVSFNLTLRCEKFIEEGFGTISTKKMAERITLLIELYEELLSLLDSFRKSGGK